MLDSVYLVTEDTSCLNSNAVSFLPNVRASNEQPVGVALLYTIIDDLVAAVSSLWAVSSSASSLRFLVCVAGSTGLNTAITLMRNTTTINQRNVSIAMYKSNSTCMQAVGLHNYCKQDVETRLPARPKGKRSLLESRRTKLLN